MSATLERIRQQLNQLIESAAAAVEDATDCTAIAAAYDRGRRDRQAEILALIGQQREWMARGRVSVISLDTLARIIGGAPA